MLDLIKVLKTFSEFLATYVLFIISFGFSFYILLHKDIPPKGADPDSTYSFFDELHLALVKTLTMSAGEIEFADIPVKDLYGYALILVFVILIIVVMMNVLNGLAVSDVGMIRKEAELLVYKSQIDTIYTWV